MPDQDAAASFNPLRPRLIRIAYRMLGSVAEAEDMVQEAFLRWYRADRDIVRDPAAFLISVVTRLCLDGLKSARARRETYLGPWLPEPVFETPAEDSDDITLTLMIALERLSPLERAAFLLHDVFGVGFEEVARVLERDTAACRQLASRARTHVRTARPRFPLDEQRGHDLAAAFFTASRQGDMRALQDLLTADVAAYTDGGGLRPAAVNPIFGQSKVIRLFQGLARKSGNHAPPILRRGLINGLPGFVTLEQDGLPQTTALAIDGNHISAIYIVRNPDKLRHVSRALRG